LNARAFAPVKAVCKQVDEIEDRKLLEKEGYLLYDTTLLDDIYIKSETFKTTKRRKLLL